MNELKGNVCESCGNYFEENDDIVFCPDCGAPIHRECWNKTKECPFASRHAEGFRWEPVQTDEKKDPAQAEEIRFEGADGEEEVIRVITPDDSVFNEKKYMGVSEKEMMCFLNVNDTQRLYRLSLFKHMAESGKKVSFNLFTGWLSPYNQFYKGMLPLGVLVIALRFLVSLPQIVVYYAYIFNPDLIDRIANNSALLNTMSLLNYFQLVVMILLCMFGDYLYLLYMVKKIKKMRLEYGDGSSDEYFSALVDAGKTRWSRVFICIGIQIVLVLAAMLVIAGIGL